MSAQLSSEQQEQRHALLWGKWDGLQAPLPLIAHALDTAAVALRAWEQWTPQVRQNLSALLAGGQQDLAAARFAVLAGAHDSGKATREFSGQGWSRRADQFTAHREALTAAGLPMDVPVRPRLQGAARQWLRHDAVTGLILHGRTALPAWARLIVSAHHGRFRAPLWDVPVELAQLRARAADPAWATAQNGVLAQLTDAVGEWTGVREGLLSGWPGRPGRRLLPVVVTATGLVSVMDWLASDDAFVRRAPRELLAQDQPGYLRVRVDQAAELVEQVWGGASGTPIGTFTKLFEGREPRGAAQRWVTGRLHGPGLTVLMVPPGEGKTEAALYLHAHPEDQQPGGLFFAMPTTATADAMLDRVRAFWAGTPAWGSLVHARAVLDGFYAPTALAPLGVCEDDPEAVGLQPSDWCVGRHRAVLAPVAVGTGDQALAGALAHRYLTVRLAALTGRHVVLDEVHTYDPYMHVLLCRLLGWLGAHRCRVTVLSATLPRARLADVLRAWTAGWHAGSSPHAREQLVAALPDPLPYPAVVTARDTITCQPLTTWREYGVAVLCHRLPADPTGRLHRTVALLRQLREQHPHARIGVIVNQVDRAIAVQRALLAAGLGAGTRSVLLHSRMPAGQRRAHTEQLQSLIGPGAPAGPVLMVATQIAEAALDLDLDVLVSDLAPMSSLVQRTGRLWRHSTTTGSGWTHPAQLAYRHGDPTLHVLATVAPNGQVTAGRGALPYTAAELRRTWTHPACLDNGQRTQLRLPQDLQPAVDAAHLTLDDLAGAAGTEADDTQETFRHLTGVLRGSAAAQRTGVVVDELPGWPADTADDDPWGRDDPDWSPLTAPTLWDDTTGAVTRLQDLEQVQLLLHDPTGSTRWAWHGTPSALLDQPTRDQLHDALSATVPVSGHLARQLRYRALHRMPDGWQVRRPALLRGVLPLNVHDAADLVRLDPDLGLIRLESP